MSLQSQVYTSAAPGVPGAKADANLFDYYPQTLCAQEAVSAGTFVWAGSDPESDAAYGGSAAPLGLVERAAIYTDGAGADGGSLVIPAGESLSIATRGAFWVICHSAAAVGDAVYASRADGSVYAGPAASADSDELATGWTVVTAGAAGETIIIKRS